LTKPILGFPSNTLANKIQFQFGANNKIKGTGIPNNHPKTNTFFLPNLSEILPAKRLRMALTKPKLAIKDNINELDSKSNSSFPKIGMTVCSRPIIAPTKALTTINNTNWLMLGFKPN
jgi:hypothetical protein